MALVSYLGKRRLPPGVKQIFQSTDIGLSSILIPAVVLLEIGYLSEKNRINVSLADVRTHISQYQNYEIQALTFEIVESAFQIDNIPELHDRLIAGTARHLGLSLITNNPVILASEFLNTVWV